MRISALPVKGFVRDGLPALPIDVLRQYLRKRIWWNVLRETYREGWRQAAFRRGIQRHIDQTPPLRTARAGSVEVRTLTWRRDWRNLIWALKSFYHFSGVDYPLFIHDGGLLPGQARRLQQHFPDATLISRSEADIRIDAHFARQGHERSRSYRLRSPLALKLFDFFAFSTADYLVLLDSDVVFFQRPEHLLVPPEGLPRNRFNRDQAYFYSMELDEMEHAFGVRPLPLINTGVAVIRRESVDFDAIERWLAHPKLLSELWLTEQTLLALCSTVHGVEYLPSSYLVSVKPGLTPDLVCKHYPGYFRSLLYREGQGRLLELGFPDALRARAPRPTPTPASS